MVVGVLPKSEEISTALRIRSHMHDCSSVLLN